MAGDKKSKLAALAELKRTREGGARQWKESIDDAIYDEVSDEQYMDIVRERHNQDDFVEDDGVGGYNDTGMDDWGEDVAYHEDDEDDDNASRKNKKKSTKKSKAKPPPVIPTINSYRPVIPQEKEEDFMQSLLSELDSKPSFTPLKNASRKRKNDYDVDSSPVYRNKASYDDTSSDGPLTPGFDFNDPTNDDFYFSPKKKIKTDPAVGIATSSFGDMQVQSSEGFDIPMDASVDIEEEEDILERDLLEMKAQDQARRKEKTVIAPIAEKEEVMNVQPTRIKEDIDAIPSWLSVYDTLTLADNSSEGTLSMPTRIMNTSNISALEPDGSLLFFWLDYLELEGRVYFVGKLKDKNSGSWVSCCVAVGNLERNLYLLPRKRRIVPSEDKMGYYETDEAPTEEDVYNDFDDLRTLFKVQTFQGKTVKRKYAFGEDDVPREETEWMKIIYPFTEPAIRFDENSKIPNASIAKIFGTNTSAFELLVLKRKIMGPCWLQIKEPLVETKGFSWCKLEVTVNNSKNIIALNEGDERAPKELPLLNVMSLSIRTVVNRDLNTQEVVCVTARTWQNMAIDNTTPPEKLPCHVQTFVRPLISYPPNFVAAAKAQSRGNIYPVQNERALLNSLINCIHKADPDVYVGHDFLSVSLDSLLHRLRFHKAEHWSRLGRFRRSAWPTIGKQGTNMKFLAGRMLCDLSSDSAKSMISSTTWSLTEMCNTHLSCERQDIEPADVVNYMDPQVSSPDRLMNFVYHCELDAHYQMAIASKVQILPLTMQLTNLAGNSWNKTLNGGRAERNEYILLHEFHRLKYIPPDKSFGKKFGAIENADGSTGSKKRDKYKGGLVLEPKRGLYDRFILVMDFNSLYPSIIQEYNIDFTTVEKLPDSAALDENGDEIMAEPPAKDVPLGVLPRLIKRFVARRAQVKSLMKDKTISSATRLQYDIRQLALKLTANSMYGCLGFEYSRFYARHLAALITSRGREILKNTAELAENMSLDVVYGDTDSVFVNSNVTELSEALKISNNFKKCVNDRYRLLEIDLDGIFQRLLLLQKKKYAALKVVDGDTRTVEVKGLDMKRREYCILSKNVSKHILGIVLSEKQAEDALEEIHEYLEEVGNNVRSGKYDLADFIMNKRLGKNPGDYPKTEGQFHVQVALAMMERGGKPHAGDVIPYIYCTKKREKTVKKATANTPAETRLIDPVYHPDEIKKNSDLQIDYDYYLSHQLLPPIERLCDPIAGTDRSRLAACLGLDSTKYKPVMTTENNERLFASFGSLMTDNERFSGAVPFMVRCRHCSGEFEFPRLSDEKPVVISSGVYCFDPECRKPLSLASLQAQLEFQIRQYIAKFYEAWVTCECGYRTRSMRVRGDWCARPDCKNTCYYEYNDADLYKQLGYFASLFDSEHIMKMAPLEKQETLTAVVTLQSDFLKEMFLSVEKYLNQSGRRWIDMASIFSFMKI